MRIDLLKEFMAVVQYGSITSAAKALYISQPTLSKHIASLEKTLGHKLFFDERPLILTDAGRILMEYASSVISQTHTMELRLKALKNQKSELIRIQDLTFFRDLASKSARIKSSVNKQYSGATFEIVKCKSHQTPFEALNDGDIDVGFSFSITETPHDPAIKIENGICLQPLCQSAGEFRLGVPKDSPLLQLTQELTLKDFANQHFFIMAGRHHDGFIQDFRKLCLAEGFDPQIEFVTVNSYRDFWTRDYGKGIVFLDITGIEAFTAADDYLANRYKAIKPYTDRSLYVLITMLYRNEKHGNALQAFIDSAKALTREALDGSHTEPMDKRLSAEKLSDLD